MQHVMISVVRDGRLTGSEAFDVYGDNGTGDVDFTRPLNEEPLRLWPVASANGAHLCRKHLAASHIRSDQVDGHLSDRNLSGLHLQPAAERFWTAGPYCFGRFHHAIVLLDAQGNRDTEQATIPAKTINSRPRRATRMRLAGFDSQADRARFHFAKSPDVSTH